MTGNAAEDNAAVGGWGGEVFPYAITRHCPMVPLRQARDAGDHATIPTDMPMIDLSQIDELARRLSGLVPPALREGREEMQDNFKSALQAGLARLDLVTREEFDVQRAVLTRTREQLESLRSLVEQLEAQLAPRDDTRNTPPPQA